MTALFDGFITAKNKQAEGDGENHIDHLLLLYVIQRDRLSTGGLRIDDG